jgi:hypothetical protein
MRKLLWCLALLACLAPAARAQDVELFGGYSYLRTKGTFYEHVNLNGFNAAASVNVKSWGVVADFSNHYGASKSNFTPIGNGGHGATFLFGPQYSFRKIPHVTPFVHAMVGGVHGARFTFAPLAPGGACPFPGCIVGLWTVPERAFAMAFGGGIDFKVRDHIWIRALQADYLAQKFSDGPMHSPRISAGIVYRFGRK